MNGLNNINVELTTKCNKSCWVCNHKEDGEMPLELVEHIAKQVPIGTVVQLHNGGEPLLYEELSEALAMFGHCHTGFNTNGKLLVARNESIIDNLDTITISIIQDDKEGMQQLDIARTFLALKGDRSPLVIFRFLGDIDSQRAMEWQLLASMYNCIIVRRGLRSPNGTYGYTMKQTIPEMGICLDFLHHLSVKANGDTSICISTDDEGYGVLGNAWDETLMEMWHGRKRMEWLHYHKTGRRDKIPLCSKCQYWGLPSSGK